LTLLDVSRYSSTAEPQAVVADGIERRRNHSRTAV
jgi:hypothetical protein